MNRVYVFKDKSNKNGKVMVLENTLEEFKSKISALFDIVGDNVKIYSSNGCEIHDLRVIRDDENVYLLPSVKQNNEDCDNIENSTKDLEEGIENIKSKVVSDWITLNVGGKRFTTSRATLLAKEPLSMLARMFADDNNMYLMNPSATDETGAYLIDRSPEYFEPILNYLRHGNVVLDNHVNPKGVLEEAIFYGIDSMIPQLNQLLEESISSYGKNQALSRMDVVRSIVMTSITSELRFQGVNLAGADLNRLDLRNINFKVLHKIA
ncbi:BTB/POZ domain-containing protein KCTD9 [Hyposmocoma kahamanoa]|uniref:BTB/POZ domain-containing protein KCTD9 n=1 Tax=Hyposmocoma kahamanoa TaxID=1477025 RepID=UPI000E6DA4BD|nr:BTB/POZ domain-containing protein KCTD9 [Hyposmocoma kahamanoa]